MGAQQNRGASWVVVTWKDQDGKWYCHNLDEAELKVATEFDRLEDGTMASLMQPRAKPVMTLNIRAAVAECAPKTTHQQAIDTTQRMLNERRP